MMSIVDAQPTVAALVLDARAGDQRAWDQIVERYAPLVWATCRRYGLSGADADDVAACVWLRLVEKLDTIREPAALPGWLATTTRHECFRVTRAHGREVPTEHDHRIVDDNAAAADEWLLIQERHIALRSAFADLPERCRELLALLFADDAPPYQAVGTALDMSVGSIGPTRQRCIDKLRGHPAMAELTDSATMDTR